MTAKGVHHGITRDPYGRPNGELFTPIDILSSDMGIWVNTSAN